MRTKKVISFSLWGDNEGYVNGALENAKLAPVVYPGWVCRFYCDGLVPAAALEALRNAGAEVVWVGEIADWRALYWRFRPMYDDCTVERFIVRDTDSRLNMREADAVQEWIDSGLPFHVMRDNPAHNIEIMGGMWGSVAGLIPDFAQLMARWIEQLEPNDNPKGTYHGTDQIFLCKHIWPRIKHQHMAHDEHFLYTGRERPFSVKLKRDGYVGMVYSDADADRCQPIEGGAA